MSAGAMDSVAEPPAQGDSEEERKCTVAEMFCGCGGLSHGFTRTGQFRVVLGNDIKKARLRLLFTIIRESSRLRRLWKETSGASLS